VPEPRFATRIEGDDCVVEASGELDMASADALQNVLDPLHGSVAIDLSGVSFLDSSTIRVFVLTRKRLNAEGGNLRLLRPHDVPRRAIELCGLGDWIVAEL
jgi:anti-sigma B factor antagonist